MADTEVQWFSTTTDMLAVPADKIDAFCEDLRLWLHMHAEFAQLSEQCGVVVTVTSRTDAFGWVDDGKHDARVSIEVIAETKQ